jgi:hypothetical protein
MFRALLAHTQEAIHKRHLTYCVRVISVVCTKNKVDLQARNIQSAICAALPKDEQVFERLWKGRGRDSVTG